MIAIITADIIGSRQAEDAGIWLKPLKKHLKKRFGSQPDRWEIYRGDSIQVAADPGNILLEAFHLKALIRSIRDMDIRMGIGIGKKTYQSKNITESNGPAFVRSGEALDSLKRGETLKIISGWADFDEEMNLFLKLSDIIISEWKPATAEVVNHYLYKPDLSQTELGKRLGMKQSSVSDALSRASYYELMELTSYFRKKINQQVATS